jgi:hypothetical protein
VLSAVAATRAAAGGWSGVASTTVAVVFAAGAIWKLASPRGWRRTLAAHGLPRVVERFVGPVTPLAEAVVPVLALLGAPRAAAWWSLGLLALFTAEILRMRAVVGPRVACGCFGRRRQAAATTLLARNTALAATAWIAIVTDRQTDGLRWPGSPSHGEILPLVLATAGLLVAVFVAWRSAAWLGKVARA